MILSKAEQYAIINTSLSGKQVKILHEPVAVRCNVFCFFLPDAANWGQAIENNLEKVKKARTAVEIPG